MRPDTHLRKPECILENNFKQKLQFPFPQLVVDVDVGNFQGYDFQEVCWLARQQDLRQFVAGPPLTRPRRFALVTKMRFLAGETEFYKLRCANRDPSWHFGQQSEKQTANSSMPN